MNKIKKYVFNDLMPGLRIRYPGLAALVTKKTCQKNTIETGR